MALIVTAQWEYPVDEVPEGDEGLWGAICREVANEMLEQIKTLLMTETTLRELPTTRDPGSDIARKVACGCTWVERIRES